LADILLALPLIIMFEITLILNHILQGVSKIRKS
jgi:Sec-independent protein secretion pathway component TatC